MKFGARGHYRGALRQVDRSLATITQYEQSFLLSKAGLLSCMERWRELASLLRNLLQRYPRDVEVWNNIADLFMAHGDWQSSLAVLKKAQPLIRASADPYLVDNYYDTKLTCMYALGHKARALYQGQSVLKRLPRQSSTQAVLDNIRSGKLDVSPWAPKSATYLRGLRRLAT